MIISSKTKGLISVELMARFGVVVWPVLGKFFGPFWGLIILRKVGPLHKDFRPAVTSKTCGCQLFRNSAQGYFGGGDAKTRRASANALIILCRGGKIKTCR